MKMHDHSQFRLATLEARLRASLAGFTMPNGTEAAAAVATALRVDLRRSGLGEVGIATLEALGDDQLFETAFLLGWQLQAKGGSVKLPLGSPVTSHDPGGVSIGGENWVLVAGEPGLFPVQTTRRDPHGPNLELLRTEITRLTRRLACRRIGLPHASFIVDTDARDSLQFPPFADAGGVVLQRFTCDSEAPRFCSALPSQIKALAKSMVEDMRALWTRREAIGARAAQIRSVAEDVAAEHGAAVLKVAVDLSRQREDPDFSMYIEYEATDEAMRTGPVLDFIPSHDATGRDHWGTPLGLDGRGERLAALRSSGADGWIDEFAAGALSIAPMGAREALRQLKSRYELTFATTCGGDPIYVTLYWQNGVVLAETLIPGKLDQASGRITLIDVRLPETVAAAAAGRRLDDLIELPFPTSCTIETVRNEGHLRIDLAPRRRFVDLDSGRIWDDPDYGSR